MFDERFRTNHLRTQHHAALEPILNDVFRQRTTAEWLAILAEICLIGPVNTIDQVVADPQVQAREMIVPLPTWNGGLLRVSGSPMKFSRTPAGPWTGADRPGGHTAAILHQYAGLSDDQLADLAARGVIALGG
jgi:CoA:oxalate CoA-transferase